VAISVLGYFFYLCSAFTAIMMLLISLLNDPSPIRRLSHYPRPIIGRTVSIREGPLTTAFVERAATPQKTNLSEAIEASATNNSASTPVLSTINHEQKLKIPARKRDKPMVHRYEVAFNHTYGSSFANQFIAFGGSATAR
jgi:hypothetical protein